MSDYSQPRDVSSVFATIATHYGRRPFPDGIRIPCPAHGGEDDNCAVFVNDAGEVRAKCHSHGCDTYSILYAIEQATGIERINPTESEIRWREADRRGVLHPYIRDDGSCSDCRLFNGAHHPQCPARRKINAAIARLEYAATIGDWDAHCVRVWAAMELPPPFPMELPDFQRDIRPVLEWIFADKRGEAVGECPELGPPPRTHHLPQWAERALEGARHDANPC